MIGFLKGNIEGIYSDYVLLDVNGVGYNVFMPASSLDRLHGLGNEVKIYTYLSVREDAMHLYGFQRKDELDIFKLLIMVNGIGPKGAVSLLNVMSADDLRFAIISGDSKSISKAPGVGAKTAQRIIIDLKDKISLEDAFETKLANCSASEEADMNVARNEAIEALVALGYSASDATKAVRECGADSDADVEAIIKLAFKQLTRM